MPAGRLPAERSAAAGQREVPTECWLGGPRGGPGVSLLVDNGGEVGAVISSGGTEIVGIGGFASRTNVSSGGRLIDAGGNVVSPILRVGATLALATSGTLSELTIGNRVTLEVLE